MTAAQLQRNPPNDRSANASPGGFPEGSERASEVWRHAEYRSQS